MYLDHEEWSEIIQSLENGSPSVLDEWEYLDLVDRLKAYQRIAEDEFQKTFVYPEQEALK